MKRTFTNYLIYFTALFFITSNKAIAQYEPAYTQYMFNESFINPAFVGSQECISSTLLYRNQWVGINGAPKTQTFSTHAPLLSNKMGAGIGILNEKIGITNQTALFLNYAYRIPLSSGKLSFGIQGGVLAHKENVDKISTSTANDIKFLTTSNAIIAPNFGFGTYYYTNKLFAGVSIPRLIKNKTSTAGTINSLNPSYFHYFITAGYLMEISPFFKLKPTILTKIAAGAPIAFDLSVNGLLKEVLWLGASYRTGNAISAILGYQLSPQFRVGYAYDYTLSGLQQFNSGSHEITLNYLFRFDKQQITTPRYF